MTTTTTDQNRRNCWNTLFYTSVCPFFSSLFKKKKDPRSCVSVTWREKRIYGPRVRIERSGILVAFSCVREEKESDEMKSSRGRAALKEHWRVESSHEVISPFFYIYIFPSIFLLSSFSLLLTTPKRITFLLQPSFLYAAFSVFSTLSTE